MSLVWIWLPTNFGCERGSIIWKALVNAPPMVGRWVAWKIGNEIKLIIGEDPWDVLERNSMFLDAF